MKPWIVLPLTFWLTFCVDNNCYRNRYANITNYKVAPDTKTPSGINVMTNGFKVDPVEIDRQTDFTEKCLKKSAKRSCVTVVIAPDWYVSKCSGQQLFPCGINKQVCLDKDLTEEDLAKCPCACRATIQNENVIVTTPNLYLYRAELARMITSVNNPWVPGIQECLLDKQPAKQKGTNDEKKTVHKTHSP